MYMCMHVRPLVRLVRVVDGSREGAKTFLQLSALCPGCPGVRVGGLWSVYLICICVCVLIK